MYGYGGDPVQGGRTMTVEIGGRDRFKFFKRPVVPSMDGQPQAPLALTANRPTIHRALQPRSQLLQSEARGTVMPHTKPRLDPVPKKPGTAPAGASHGDATGDNADGTREMSCQTMMRENDCQTDPYTPDYFVEEGHEPEVLAIMELRYGEGLPAGLGEVEMIDRVQRRKNVETQLPQGNDNGSMQARLTALETLEKTEWDEREEHIRGLQEARLKQIDSALHRREAKREEASKQRVEAMKKAKLAEVESQLQKMQEKRLVATRKLTAKHANPCCEKPKREIIGAHATHGAQGKEVTTNALVEKINTNNYDVRPTLLSFPEGLQELERTAVPKMETVKESKLQPPSEKAVSMLGTNFQKRKAKQVQEDLDYADGIIETSKQEKQAQQSVQDLYRATPRLQRPDTPTLLLQGDEEEEREEAMLLLQRLLRGRAVQNDFFEGKERCHGLIEELQAASNAKGHEEWWRPEKEKEDFHAQQDTAVQSVVDEAQGDVVFGTLDYLYKELLRQQEAAKVDRLRMLAEATRAEREAAEAKRRAAERAVRAAEEYQYARVVRSTDATVETFLEQMLQRSVSTTARTQAVKEQLRDRAEQPSLNDSVAREEYVCNLLDSFVIPLVVEKAGDKDHERVKALAHVATGAALDAMAGL